jgi:Tfp pilus assembly protein PilZ
MSGVNRATRSTGAPRSPGELAGGDSQALRITIKNSAQFVEVFDQALSNYEIFLATPERYRVGEIVEFVVVIPYNKRELPGTGEVTCVVESGDRAGGGGQPGVGIKVLQFDMPEARKARRVIAETLAGTAAEGSERRRWPRLPASLPVRFWTKETLGAGLTRDLSTGGMYLCALEPVPVGTEIRMALVDPIDGDELMLTGEVARTPVINEQAGPPIGLGIRFFLSDEGFRKKMGRFVSALERRRFTAKGLRNAQKKPYLTP